MVVHRVVTIVATCLVVAVVVPAAFPWTPTSQFIGGAGDCYDDPGTPCSTAGPPGASCTQEKATCEEAEEGWKECYIGQGNASTECENDDNCADENHSLRKGADCGGE